MEMSVKMYVLFDNMTIDISWNNFRAYNRVTVTCMVLQNLVAENYGWANNFTDILIIYEIPDIILDNMLVFILLCTIKNTHKYIYIFKL